MGSAATALSNGTVTAADVAPIVRAAQQQLDKSAGMASSPGLQQRLGQAASDLGKWRVGLLSGDPGANADEVASSITAVRTACGI